MRFEGAASTSREETAWSFICLRLPLLFFRDPSDLEEGELSSQPVLRSGRGLREKTRGEEGRKGTRLIPGRVGLVA